MQHIAAEMNLSETAFVRCIHDSDTFETCKYFYTCCPCDDPFIADKRPSPCVICVVNLPDDVTLGGAFDEGGASPGSRDLLQWEVNLQDQQQRRLFLLKVAEVAAKCAHLASAGPWYVSV